MYVSDNIADQPKFYETRNAIVIVINNFKKHTANIKRINISKHLGMNNVISHSFPAYRN